MNYLKANKLLLGSITMVLMLGITSCKKETYNKLTAEEMKWMAYDTNEQMVFQSTLGNVRQHMGVKLKTKGYRRSGETYNEFSQVQFQHYEDTSVVNPGDKLGELLLVKVNDTFAVYFSWPHFPIESELTSLPVTTAIVKGQTFTDIRLIDATAFANQRFYITTVWYSKKYGVVQYEDIFGRKFYRLS